LILIEASPCAYSTRSRLDAGQSNSASAQGENQMQFYTKQHRHYCGIDLHARTLYVCVLDQASQVLAHKNLRATPDAFLEAVAPFREDLVVAVECIFT
jgi:hypothetical protein